MWPSSSTPSASGGPGRGSGDRASTAWIVRAPRCPSPRSDVAPPPPTRRRGARRASRRPPRAGRPDCPTECPGALAGIREDVDTARRLDHLRAAMAGAVGRVEPFDRGHAHRRGACGGSPDRLDTAAQIWHGVARPPRPRRRPPRASGVGEHLVEPGGIEREHLGQGREPSCDRDDVVGRDRADRADLLGDDQFDLEFSTFRRRGRTASARSRPPAHRRVDLGRVEAARIMLLVRRGSSATAAGWSHSWVTATTWSPGPSANSISVDEGTRLAIRIGTDYRIAPCS